MANLIKNGIAAIATSSSSFFSGWGWTFTGAMRFLRQRPLSSPSGGYAPARDFGVVERVR